MQKKGLGKGLSALIPVAEEPRRSEPLRVPVDRIHPSRLQPRRGFDTAAMEDLARSIREQGLLQPILVRRTGADYELIAGERRWRAAKAAGLFEVPVVLREASDGESLEIALVENLQREDLDPVEEAEAYRRLQEEFGWSQERIAERVGKSRPAIANALRLLSLPGEVQEEISAGRLGAGHARALLALEEASLILAAARKVITAGLSVRATERLVRSMARGRQRRRKRDASTLDPDLRSLLDSLQRRLGTKVRLRGGTGGGRIEIDYYSTSDLDRILQKILGGAGPF
jgi:ParB family chromosome partitioning protein